MVAMQEKSEGGSPVQRRARAILPPATTEATATHSTFGPSSHATPRASSVDDGFRHRFKSYRLRGEYEKPWLVDPAMKKTRWNNYIVWAWLALGVIGSGVICFFLVWPYRNLDVSVPVLSPSFPIKDRNGTELTGDMAETYSIVSCMRTTLTGSTRTSGHTKCSWTGSAQAPRLDNGRLQELVH